MSNPSTVSIGGHDTKKVVPSATMVETYTGRFVDTRRPDPATLCLEDIAHALANVCRFGGHSQRFYSVAEHAVLVSRRLEHKGYDRTVCLGAVHHDDPEAYLGDIPRPLKPLLGKAYERLTERMDTAIITALGIPDHREFHAVIKEADNWALLLEARFLLPSRGVNWTAAQKEEWGVEFGDTRRVRTPDYWTGGVSPAIAEQFYLARHRELTEV